ncbi:MAG: DUF1573 domain-containing protein [Ignavibacteria bacterium]|nr:DUF1573 domain-containing protein [Ignavibacteria bacterium]
MQHLNFIFTLTILIVTLTGNLFFSENSESKKDKNARIQFNELKYDFGKVEEGIQLSHIFKFKNTGEETLIIKSVNAGCGCTGVTVGDKKEYREGEEGEIKVSFNTQGRSGIQSKSVYVQTNDPEKPNIDLIFTCEVISTKKN